MKLRDMIRNWPKDSVIGFEFEIEVEEAALAVKISDVMPDPGNIPNPY